MIKQTRKVKLFCLNSALINGEFIETERFL